MKYPVSILALLIACPIIVSSQQTEERLKNILKSPDGYMYTDNTKGAYFCVDFKGDSLSDPGIENGFNIDGSIYQIMLSAFSQAEYAHGQDSAKETALLKSKMQYELDYISKEVFKKKIVSGFEIFKNKDGKNYFLWNYIPPAPENKDTSMAAATQQYFLTFVANQHVVGINTPVFEGEKAEDRKNALKQLADRIDVFGARIDVDGMYYKLDSRAEGKDLQYVDSANKYTLTIKEWFNITESPASDVYIGTLPDIDNIQNAILVKKFKKADYTSFSDFNEKILPGGLKVGDRIGGGTFLLKKELPKPSKVNGMSYKIQVMRGSTIYDSHYTSIETGACYLLVIFTATPETFALNEPRFLEFIDDIELMK